LPGKRLLPTARLVEQKSTPEVHKAQKDQGGLKIIMGIGVGSIGISGARCIAVQKSPRKEKVAGGSNQEAGLPRDTVRPERAPKKGNSLERTLGNFDGGAG